MRGLLVLPVLVLGLLVAGPGQAGACACGAVLADERLQGVEETALVEVGDGRQSITLNIAGSTSSGEVAFLMPVPARSTFELADGAVFTELDEVSAPRVEYRDVVSDGDGSGGAAPGGMGVTVTDHVEVGPFEVAQLSGVDSGAVSEWLGANDFVLPPDLGEALTPYLADGWLVVAVRLTPEESFAEGLPPMRFTFATDEPVYPMRLSATGDHSQPLRLYVLADHRMDASNPAPDGGAPELTFAGRLDPVDLTEHPTLASIVDTPRYLTRYDATFSAPTITDDIRLTRSATDDPYRATVVETRYVPGMTLGELVVWFLAGVTALGAAIALVLWVRRARQAPRDPAGRRIR